MKKLALVLAMVLVIVSESRGDSFIYGYRSIGYWNGGGASLVAARGQYDSHYNGVETYFSFSQSIENYQAKTITTISSEYGEDLKIENSKHGVAKVNKWQLLGQIGINVKGASKSKVEVWVLPNDNILYIVELERTVITGSLKLQDRVENIYGYPMVIEGATVPLKDNEVQSWGFILDRNNGYKPLNAFPVPTHASIVPSVGGRFYLLNNAAWMWGNEIGYKDFYCYDFNGTLLWKYHNNIREEWFGTFQETLDNVYFAGSEKGDNGEFHGIIRVLNVKNGKTVKTMPNEKFYGAYCIYANYFKDGFEWGTEQEFDREDGGRLKYIKEDENFRILMEKEYDTMISNIAKRKEEKAEAARIEAARGSVDDPITEEQAKQYSEAWSQAFNFLNAANNNIDNEAAYKDYLRKADACFKIIQSKRNSVNMYHPEIILAYRSQINEALSSSNRITFDVPNQIESEIKTLYQQALAYIDNINEANSKEGMIKYLKQADELFVKILNTPNYESVISTDTVNEQRENIQKVIEMINQNVK